MELFSQFAEFELQPYQHQIPVLLRECDTQRSWNMEAAN